MSEDDLTNLGNPVNDRHDEEERNQPHVTPVPLEADADDLFDDTVDPQPASRPDEPRHPPANPID